VFRGLVSLFRVQGFGVREVFLNRVQVQGTGFRVQGSGFSVLGSGFIIMMFIIFRVEDLAPQTAESTRAFTASAVMAAPE